MRKLPMLYAVSLILKMILLLNRAGVVELDLTCFIQIYLTLNGTLTGTTTPGQSEHGSNGNERVTLYSQELQNWSLTTRGSLVSYLVYSF